MFLDFRPLLCTYVLSLLSNKRTTFFDDDDDDDDDDDETLNLSKRHIFFWIARGGKRPVFRIPP